MSLYKNKYRIESTRLKVWDYSSNGYYFISICIKNRLHLLGHIANGQMILNEYGNIVKQCWFDLPNHYPNIKLDAFCMMPNHIHGIIVIDNGMVYQSQKRHGLFKFIRALKTFSARRINEMRHSVGETVWQQRFHDHIIRDNTSLERIRAYITNNSKTWNEDRINMFKINL